MSNPSEEDTLTASYVETSGVRREGRCSLRPGELEWVLISTLRWNSLRLKLLAALQGALALPTSEERDASSKDALVGELKAALTNVIIMQTRLNERDKELVALLEQAQRRGLLEPVEVETEDAHNWAESVAQAHHHIEQRASTTEETSL